MSYDFSGKCALVTGASRGIGKAVTKQLVQCGAKVFALSKNPDNLAALKKEIAGIETICVDVTNWNESKKLVEEIDDIDFFINNAGIAKLIPFGEITEEVFDSVFSVNFKAAINLSQVVVDKLKKKGKPGSIVNMSSVSSMSYIPNSLIYSASKAALDKLTKTMAVELAPFKIRVNSVNPTFVDTDMLTPFVNTPGLEDSFKKLIPFNEFCSAEDIANSVLFLLSEKARMITGAIFPVDGGHTCK